MLLSEATETHNYLISETLTPVTAFISFLTGMIRGTVASLTSSCETACKDSPGLVEFTIRLVNSVFNLPDGQVMFLRNSNNRRTVFTVKSILLVKKFLGVVEMTFGLVNASFSLREWQAVKTIFFAPCES